MEAELKIYEKGHWGYAAIIAGGILGLFAVLTVLLALQNGGDPSFTWALFAVSALLIVKGIREAGKPLIHLTPSQIEVWHKKKRIGVPLSRLEKVAFRDNSLWIRAAGMDESVEVSLHKVKSEKREQLRLALAPLDIGDES